MKILVLGASQGTGALCVKKALDLGHDVTAFARSPQRLSLEHERLTRTVGDIHDAASVSAAVAGHDAVIITASVGSLSTFKAKPDYFSLGTIHAITAMKAHGVRRLVVLSAFGAGESRALAGFLLRTLMIDGFLKLPFVDHEVQERVTRESGLDFVIARPGRLTNGAARGTFVKTAKIEKVPSSISRADLAAFLVESCESRAFVGQAVQLGG